MILTYITDNIYKVADKFSINHNSMNTTERITCTNASNKICMYIYNNTIYKNKYTKLN